MTLIYSLNTVPCSLTVPDEAARGLFSARGSWFLYVNDPMAQAVSLFRLTEQLVKAASESICDGKPIPLRAGKKFLDWLLKQEAIDVEYITIEGMARGHSAGKVAGPNPTMDLPDPLDGDPGHSPSQASPTKP